MFKFKLKTERGSKSEKPMTQWQKV